MSLITVAGYAAVLYLVAKLLTYLSKYVRSPLDVNKLGDWSLVTGATDGIGKKNIKHKLSVSPASDQDFSVQVRDSARSLRGAARTSCWSAAPSASCSPWLLSWRRNTK